MAVLGHFAWTKKFVFFFWQWKEASSLFCVRKMPVDLVDIT